MLTYSVFVATKDSLQFIEDQSKEGIAERLRSAPVKGTAHPVAKLPWHDYVPFGYELASCSGVTPHKDAALPQTRSSSSIAMATRFRASCRLIGNACIVNVSTHTHTHTH